MKSTNFIQDFVKSSSILGRMNPKILPKSSTSSKKVELTILAYFESRGNVPDKVKLAKTLNFIIYQIKNGPGDSFGLDYDFLGLELYKRCKDKESVRIAIRLFHRVSILSIKPTQIDLALGIPIQRIKGFSKSSKVSKPSNTKIEKSRTKGQETIQNQLPGKFNYPYLKNYKPLESELSDDLKRKLQEWPSANSPKVFARIKAFDNSHHEWDEDPIHRK
ncbi:hypothetical protein ACFPIK_08865 [Algoriphagus aquatilis]|uniref:Uncharacterized protein n=1 Tax=Algoriphagus aquatilis TaxID=490186 RepID=A0ABW0BVF5_9BACT